MNGDVIKTDVTCVFKMEVCSTLVSTSPKVYLSTELQILLHRVSYSK
jgi:hypothetical protein